MTTDAMNCERFNGELMEYLEHDVDAATRASVELHAGTCGDCGALLADIRKLRVDAANLPELAPSRDLWSGIAARIETPVVPIGAGPVTAERISGSATRRHLRGWIKSGLIAASLVAAGMIGYSARGVERDIAQGPMTSPPSSEPSRPAQDSEVAPQVALGAQTSAPSPEISASPDRGATAPAPGATQAAPTGQRTVEVQLAVARLTADYDREIARLRVLIDQRRSQLDPATVSVIERNLAVIDTAIAESRRAIADDPSSRFLIQFLNQSLRDKVELMRTAALLPSRT